MRKRILCAVLICIIAIAVWNYPLTYRIGIDGQLLEKKIPFYAKACGFLYRDWAYKDLVRGIAGGESDETKIVLAILGWTHDNIMAGVPRGLKTIDDHPLNIIIRQYGAEDQSEDVFTILCSYAGMPADWGRCYDADRTSAIVLSFVKIDGRWLVFDVSKNRYFMNGQARIASIEDCAAGNVVLSDKDAAVYGRYLDNIKESSRESSTRADEQMPLRRIGVIVKKAFTRATDR
jgi:hypothetical protein